MRIFSGQSAWLVQRLSALLLLILFALALASIFLRPPGFDAWRGLAASTHGAVLIALGFLAIGVHGWIGARDVVLDYVHLPWLRLGLLSLVAVLLVGVQIRVILTLARVFGAP